MVRIQPSLSWPRFKSQVQFPGKLCGAANRGNKEGFKSIWLTS